MKMFRKGPFGHLLDIQIKKCPRQLLVHLIRRMSKQSTDDTLIFNLLKVVLGGTIQIRFSNISFDILKCGLGFHFAIFANV